MYKYIQFIDYWSGGLVPLDEVGGAAGRAEMEASVAHAKHERQHARPNTHTHI